MNAIPGAFTYLTITESLDSSVGVGKTAIASAASGALTALISNKMQCPVFPETRTEMKSIIVFNAQKAILKSSAGFSASFLFYEGVTRAIDKSRYPEKKASVILRDSGWHTTNLLSGFIAGMVYRLATYPLYYGIEENPLLGSRSPIIVTQSAFKMSFFLASISFIREWIHSLQE